MSKRTYYISGYDHYSHRRNIQLKILLNQAERQALDDLLAVQGITNMSAYLRSQLFCSFSTLTPDQRARLREAQRFRQKDHTP